MQLAVVIVVADEQSAERLRARALTLGVAANDELLLVDALDLQPVAAPCTRLVRGVGALRHHALEAQAERSLIERLAVLLDVVDETDVLARDEGTAQERQA